MNHSYKTLYRSRSNRIIGGVAAGLGEYLGIDPTVVRLLFVFIGLVGWVAPAVIVYLVMMFVVPEEPLASVTSATPSSGESNAEPASAQESPAEAAPSQTNDSAPDLGILSPDQPTPDTEM